MSNPIRQTEGDGDAAQGRGAVELIIRPRDKDLGGFSVRRCLPSAQCRSVGPWVFFDHMGPADFPAGKGINVRPHPHINLATVTYLFDGEILHRDSLGNEQPIEPGDINLMVAGSGITHSERERPEVTAAPHRLHGLQLWHALPAQDEETEPAFHHYAAADLPAVKVDGVAVRVMIGSAYGVRSPVRVFGETLYVEADLRQGQSLVVPAAAERAVYVVSGSLKSRGTVIPEYAMALLSAAEGVTVEATEPSRLVVIGGAPLGERFIEWNFVSSRKERIEQAKRDWTRGLFRRIPGDEVEFIPLPD